MEAPSQGALASSRSTLLRRRLHKAGLVIAAALGGLLLTSSGSANSISHVARVTCLPELGLVGLHVTKIPGEKAFQALRQTPEDVAARTGIYGLWALVDTELTGDRDEFRIKSLRTVSVRCDLGTNIVEFDFKPKVLGASITASVTAKIDGLLVLDDLPFDTTDRDGRFIDTFSYTGERSFFSLSGSAVLDESASPYGPQFLISKIYRFDLESFEPLTDLVTVYREMYEATPGLNDD